jgi:hypothetical protein
MLATSLYVMWSAQRQLSKIGIATSPQARASQLRREKRDETIKLATCWNVLDLGPFVGVTEIECLLHNLLRDGGHSDSSNAFFSEWFEIRWPTAVEFVEQWAQLWAWTGVRLARMPGNHGK